MERRRCSRSRRREKRKRRKEQAGVGGLALRGCGALLFSRLSNQRPSPLARSSAMRARFAAVAFALVLAAPLRAQAGFMGEMHRDLNDVQKKFIDLAKAIPESAYGWQPKGARSIREVLLHVASENYFLPIGM